MNPDKRREKRKKITVTNGNGPSMILAKGLDRLVQKARAAVWIGQASENPYRHMTNSREPFISKSRQARKGVCAEMGITMKRFHKLEKLARHEGVLPSWKVA